MALALRLPPLSPRAKRMLPWAAFALLGMGPYVGATRTAALLLLAYTGHGLTMAVDDIPDGAGVRAPALRRLRAVRWIWALFGAAAVVMSLRTEGASDRSFAFYAWLGGIYAWMHAYRIHRKRLGAPEMLSYAAALFLASGVAVALHRPSDASWFAPALLAAAWGAESYALSYLPPSLSLHLARSLRRSASIVIAFTLLCLVFLALSQVNDPPVWVGAALSGAALLVGLRIDSWSRWLLPRAGARLHIFEQARDVQADSAEETISRMMRLLTEAADAGPGAVLHIDRADWNAEIFALTGRFPFGVVCRARLTAHAARHAESRAWVARLRAEEACAWLRLGSDERPVGYLVVPELYAAGQLGYEEVRVLAELSAKLTLLVLDAARDQAARTRESNAMRELQALHADEQAKTELRAALVSTLFACLEGIRPVRFYSAAGLAFRDALRHQSTRGVAVRLPRGIDPRRVLRAAHDSWLVIDAEAFESPSFVDAWRTAASTFNGRPVAILNAQRLADTARVQLTQSAVVQCFAGSSQETTPQSLELRDLQHRPEDIEAAVLDDLTEASLLRFGEPVGADELLCAHWVELAYMHGHQTLRASIDAAVASLDAPRLLTLAALSRP